MRLFLTAVFLLLTLAPAQAAPRVEVLKTTHDFGEVFEDRELSHTFVLKNTGDAVLEIRDLDSDCACTTTESDRRIPPGGQGRITLTIAPYSVLHQFKKQTKVFLNDPATPVVTLSLVGYAKPFIEIQPSHVVRLRGKPGEPVGAQVRFISHLPIPFEITGFTTDIPQLIGVHLKAEEPGKVWLVEVKNQNTAAGNYQGTIILNTNAARRPRLIMRVFGELTP
ncbi:MAG: DUF1573 domain-containing protein [Syntrophobacterales bacterium]|nr:DUF1573 domain-containing protein [Syntrophobacterales bacterium]